MLIDSLPSLVVANDGCRAAAPAPLVYVLIPRGDFACSLRCCRPQVDEDGAVQLCTVPISQLEFVSLDAVDAAILSARRWIQPSDFESESPHCYAQHMLVEAAKAGRLHRAYSSGVIGPALQWRGDVIWKCERHVECVAGGARSWIRLVSDAHSPIDCVEPAIAQIGSLFVLGNTIVDGDRHAPFSNPPESSLHVDLEAWRGPMDFAEREVLEGAQLHSREVLPYFADQLRHDNDIFYGDPWRRPTWRVDPRFGVSFFEAKPVAVLRLDGAAHRGTLDVLPLARYVDPGNANIVVDRDPRTHRIVDNPSHPELRVPRGDRQFESRFHSLAKCMLHKARGRGRSQWRVPRVQLPALLEAAAEAQFLVEVHKQAARIGGVWSLSVRSGLDWFDLDGALETPQGAIPLRELVDAARREPDAIEILPLSDGTTVLVPAKMRAVLRRLARIISTRESRSASATGSGSSNDQLHFAPSEAPLLHTLLQQADRTQEDAAFRDLRQRLKNFHTPRALPPPASFTGTLRDYQQLGLGWFERLRELRMGGCLADEMGLGKTVQVLALLASQHESGPRPESLHCQAAAPVGPSLLVVPRSIVRNWMDEAARFVPQLRVVDVSHQGRNLSDQTFASCDVAIATYGTLIRDITQLARRAFHYVILDEAQAIRNAAARAAMAAKCLQAQHRLVMTGTPIENHVGELWSLMEFLNPALARRLEGFARHARPEEFALVRQAVRPFLLRRAKRDVARELPARIEQTLHCDMTDLQRAHYDALLERVRADLTGAVEEVGLPRAKLLVISGLLRLRQAACHPVLVDARRRGAGSGKLEVLAAMLEASALDRRKTLVFSQFTSFLALVKEQLDERGTIYESLDGQTRDRAARVRRFKEDDECAVFLLSLKAGGVGLNLQSAERVILLDPWWNPAVEAQAIDRAHRIGQKRTVHAIRLVSAGTIEERVLELQRRKRFLADSIVNGDAGPLGSMTREDLTFLLDAAPLHPDQSDPKEVMFSNAADAV